MALFISIAFFVAGVFTWTFLEYMIHRFLGHKKKNTNPITDEHHRHHAEFDYFAPAHKKAALAVVVLSILTVLTGLPFGWVNGFVYAFGLTGMYLVYEWLHKRAHTHAPLTKYGRWLRKHHFYHHFRNPRSNHGVTSPLWDMAFGTYYLPEVVKIPGKHFPLPWLFEAETLAIRPEFQRDYVLAGKAK